VIHSKSSGVCSIKRVLVLAVLGLLLVCNPSVAQSPNWPGLSDTQLNAYAHDIGHSVTAAVVIAGTGLTTDWPLLTRTVLGTVVLPIAQEIFDSLYWKVPLWTNDSRYDVLTYQLPWAYYLAKKGHWAAAIGTVFAYGAVIYWRYRNY